MIITQDLDGYRIVVDGEDVKICDLATLTPLTAFKIRFKNAPALFEALADLLEDAEENTDSAADTITQNETYNPETTAAESVPKKRGRKPKKKKESNDEA